MHNIAILQVHDVFGMLDHSAGITGNVALPLRRRQVRWGLVACWEEELPCAANAGHCPGVPAPVPDINS